VETWNRKVKPPTERLPQNAQAGLKVSRRQI
jgi:hypothetical protein